MNIQFDKQGTKNFFEWLAEKLMVLMFPKLLELFERKLSDEELLSRKEVSKRILKCDEDTADLYFLNAPGFPYVEVGKRKKYPKKMVEQWIVENSKYN